MRYLPALSDNTLTVILVLRLRACTKAPRKALPSGPATVPVMVAACAPPNPAAAAITEPNPRAMRLLARMDLGRMAVPPGFDWGIGCGECYPIRQPGAIGPCAIRID